MIDYYYYTYNQGLDDLCSRINTMALTGDIHTNMSYLNDVVLIHAIYAVIDKTELYRKWDIQQFIWNKIAPMCNTDKTSVNQRYSICEYQEGYNKLFNYCWNQKFSLSKDGRNAVKISIRAYRNRPLKNMLFNSNFFILLFTIGFFKLQSIINESYVWLVFIETHELLITGVIFVMLFTAWVTYDPRYSSKNFYYYLPIAGMAILFAYSLYIPFSDINVEPEIKSDVISNLIQRNVIMGLSYFLWYPVIYVNNERLHDLYDYSHQSH